MFSSALVVKLASRFKWFVTVAFAVILCEAAVQAQPRPGLGPHDEPVPPQLSGQASSYCYNLGVNHFIRRDYRQAYRAFSRAYNQLSDYDRQVSPRGVVIQYWRAAMLIAMRDDVGAQKLLKPIIVAAGHPLSVYTSGEVVRALEKVQGPVRRRIQDIESEILCDCDS